MKTVIKKGCSEELISFVVLVKKIADPLKEDQFYVGYKNGKLYVADINFLHRSLYMTGPYQDPLISVCNSIEEAEEDLRSDNYRYYRSGNHRVLTFDYRNNRLGEDRITFIPGAIEQFKKEFPYAPMDELLELYAAANTDRGWHTISKNYLLANFMGQYMTHPQFEQMLKNESKHFVYQWLIDIKNAMYQRAFGKGKNMNEITGMPNWMWKKLLDQGVSISIWDFIRIWNKQIFQDNKKEYQRLLQEGKKAKESDVHGFDSATVDTILNLNLNDRKTLDNIKKIINNTLDDRGQKMFTISSLFRYLERLDMYQAIPPYAAIPIFSDYVRMCKELGVLPRIDSDSLKREHDITSRNYSIYQASKREEYEAAKGSIFSERAKELEKYEYSDDNYIAIVPKTITDLINEGRNNHNCVGSYVDSFAKKRSNIFFVRHKSNPERSYITIELTSELTNYKQAFLASNERITNPRDWKFINDWLDRNKTLTA